MFIFKYGKTEAQRKAMIHTVLHQEEISEIRNCCRRADWLMKAGFLFSLNSYAIYVLVV